MAKFDVNGYGLDIKVEDDFDPSTEVSAWWLESTVALDPKKEKDGAMGWTTSVRFKLFASSEEETKKHAPNGASIFRASFEEFA